MNIRFALVVFSLTFFCFKTFAQDIPMEKHDLDAAKCSIEFPQQWITLDNFSAKASNIVIAVSTSLKETPNDNFTENIIVTSTSIEGNNKKLESRFENLVDKITRNYDGECAIVDKGSVNTQQNELKWIIYTQKTESMVYKIISYLVVVEDKEYLITCYASVDSFDKFRPIYDKVAQSFKYIK